MIAWMTTVRVVPATAERWPQLGRVFGPREKDPRRAGANGFVATRSPITGVHCNVKSPKQMSRSVCWPTSMTTPSAGRGWCRARRCRGLPSIGDLPASSMKILTRGGCPASWYAANTVGAASESRCSRPLWTGRRGTVPRYSTGTPLTPTGSPARRHHQPSSPELSPCFSGQGSARSDAPTEPDP
jgi:hypothetical protein